MAYYSFHTLKYVIVVWGVVDLLVRLYDGRYRSISI